MATFNQQLDIGSSGEEVRQLQIFLNQSGFTLAQSGPGSPGNETTFFGPLTQSAVQKFQTAQGIVSSGDPQSTGFGRVGPQTLSALNTSGGGTTEAEQILTQGGEGTLAETGAGAGQGLNIPPDDPFAGSNFAIRETPLAQQPSAEEILRQGGEGTSQETGVGAGVGLEPTIQEPSPERFEGANFIQQVSNPVVPSTNTGSAPETVEDLVNDLPPELQALVGTLSDYINALAEQGQQVNPSITITDAELSAFLTQAQQEFEPFFSGEQKAVLIDLQRSLGRSVQLQGQREEDIGRQFGQQFSQIGQTAADRGISSSGERLRLEGELGEARQRDVLRGREGLQFGAEGASLAAERQIGSSALGGFQFPLFQGQNIGRTLGNIFGQLPSDRLTAESLRASELESAERLRRRLDLAGSQ